MLTVVCCVVCEFGSFHRVPNSPCSLMNCIGLIESVECLLFVSLVDVSLVVYELSRGICAMLSSVAQRCILCTVFIAVYIVKCI